MDNTKTNKNTEFVELEEEYYIDWNRRKIFDIKMLHFVPLDKMEMILNKAGY